MITALLALVYLVFRLPPTRSLVSGDFPICLPRRRLSIDNRRGRLGTNGIGHRTERYHAACQSISARPALSIPLGGRQEPRRRWNSELVGHADLHLGIIFATV